MAKQNGKTNGLHNDRWEEIGELKKRLDALTEKQRERELDKLSPEDLHSLFWYTAYTNANRKGGRRA